MKKKKNIDRIPRAKLKSILRTAWVIIFCYIFYVAGDVVFFGTKIKDAMITDFVILATGIIIASAILGTYSYFVDYKDED